MTAAHLMARAVDFCTAHVEAGGLPFVGVVVNADGVAISGFGVNRVAETGDPMAHAEVVAIREAIARHDVHVSVRVPYSRGDLVSRIHAEGDVLTERHGAHGTAITATVPSGLARQLATLAIPEAAEQ